MGLFDFLRGKEETPPPPPQPQAPRIVQDRQPSTLRKSEGSDYYDVVCPYCMERYPVWELEFRSSSVDEDGDPDTGYPRVFDEKYAAFWEQMHQPSMNETRNFVLKVNDPQNVVKVRLWEEETWRDMSRDDNRKFVQRKAVQSVMDKFGNISSQRICPRCHNDLPIMIGRCPNYIISMMGNTASGKTVYLSRLLLSLLHNELLPGREMVVRFPMEEVSPPVFRKRLENMFFRAVERREEEEVEVKRGSRRAPRAAENNSLSDATPIKYMKPTILDLQRGDEHTLVTLFDFPGEAIWKLHDEDQTFFHNLMENLNENANGWLFLLDSTTLEPVRECIREAGAEAVYLSQKDLDDPEQNAQPSDVLVQFSNFFGLGKHIKAPVALVLSKADLITRYVTQLRDDKGCHIDTRSPFLVNSGNIDRDRVQLDDLWQCDRSLREFLQTDSALKAAKNFCPYHAWFAASATGTPVENGQLKVMAPAVRVVDPLEWLLWMLGAYGGEYTQGNPIWGRAGGPKQAPQQGGKGK